MSDGQLSVFNLLIREVELRLTTQFYAANVMARTTSITYALDEIKMKLFNTIHDHTHYYLDMYIE